MTTHLGGVEAGPGLRFWLHGEEGKAVGTLADNPHSAEALQGSCGWCCTDKRRRTTQFDVMRRALPNAGMKGVEYQSNKSGA